MYSKGYMYYVHGMNMDVRVLALLFAVYHFSEFIDKEYL